MPVKEEFNASAPAMTVLKDGTKEWRLDGKLHRANGPAVIKADGTREWWRNGGRHREDGPAIEWAYGMKEWWQNGNLHREGGPAVEADDWKFWFRDHKRHREDGPAVENADGSKEWWIDDVRMTEQEFNAIAAAKIQAAMKSADAFGKGLSAPVAAPRAARFRRTAP